MKKVLLLTHENRTTPVGELFDALKAASDVHEIVVTKDEQKKLTRFLKKLDIASFDLAILELPFKRLFEARRYTQRFDNLVFIEEDACQDRIPHSKWFRLFSDYYLMHSACRLFASGLRTCSHFAAQGVDAYFLPKAADRQLIFEEPGLERDLPFVFVGRYQSDVYKARQQAVEALRDDGLLIERADYPVDYRRLLSRSQVFFSADIGLSEYMFKNFEAMSCGAAVLAYRQGFGEESALGLKDMHNIALYSDIEEARAKAKLLMNDAELRRRIAKAGQSLVAERLNNRYKGEHLAKVLLAGDLKRDSFV